MRWRRKATELFVGSADFAACDWRPFPEVGSGVSEVRIDCADGWFRVMYVAKFEGAVYVLHSFQKSSRRTPRTDVEIAKTRYRAVLVERRSLK